MEQPDQRCLQRLTFSGAEPTATFTSAAGAGNEMTFDATGSTAPGGVAQYNWQFNDGTAPVENPTPTVSHTFPTNGPYVVALTVFAADGTSIGTARTIRVLPAVVTGGASPLTQTSATLNATVNPNGEEVSACKLEYGLTESYGSNVACTPSPGFGSNPVAVTAPVSGLATNVTYHYRISATNLTGTSIGADQTFRTLPNPPTAETRAASSVAQTTATLNATVNPNGGAVSECRFEYGTTSAYGSAASCASLPGSGEGPVAVSASLGAFSLSANTTYHFRISAANAGGVSQGSDRTFTTPPAGRAIASSFSWLKAAVNPRSGAITFTEAVGGPGAFSWLITFQNGRFGVFAASLSKCGNGLVRLKGRCRPARIVFARGSKVFSTAGSVTFTVRPSASAMRALRSALRQKRGLPVSVRLTFRSRLGGVSVSHTYSLTVRLKTGRR